MQRVALGLLWAGEMMQTRAYYNEIDTTAAHVLRCLIQDGVIAPGDVDTRSIKDVKPDDLKTYTQCHFFAGGGLWSVAARLAGWPDDKPLWTGSCPCQPFSQAGQGRGVADERHLWPDFHQLIAAVRPPVVVGEQVAGKAGYGWLDEVRADLGAEGYASGAVDIPAAAVDAPNIRQRLYWVALANTGRGEGRVEPEFRSGRSTAAGADAPVPLGDAFKPGLEGIKDTQGSQNVRPGGRMLDERSSKRRPVAEADGGDQMGNPDNPRKFQRGGRQERLLPASGRRGLHADGRNGSFWSDHEWLICHDGKARRTKPGIRMLVDGLPGRVGLWRIAGNAINAQLAAEVLGALLDTDC